MKKGLILRVTAILLIICMTAGLALTAAADYPSPTDNVYDGTGTLSNSVLETIKSTNDTLYDKVNAKISLCIVESLGGEDITTYSRNIFNEWKLGEGVLLVVSTRDENYFAVQSVGIDDVLTNDQLSTILKDFLEPDFAEGNVAKGIQKTINKLSSFMKTELPAASAEKKDTDKTSEGDEEEKKVTFGSVILSILKIILWTVIIIIAAFVIFFVAALFNDDAAELMQRYVFSHFTGSRPANNRQDYYDERLYGSPRNNNRQLQGGNQQRRLPPPNQQRQQYDRYRQGGVRYDDEYYGSYNQNNRYAQNGQYRQNKYNQYAQNGQGNGYGQQQNGGQRRRNSEQQSQYNSNYEYTQQYTINTGNSSQNNNRSQRNNSNRY